MEFKNKLNILLLIGVSLGISSVFAMNNDEVDVRDELEAQADVDRAIYLKFDIESNEDRSIVVRAVKDIEKAQIYEGKSVLTLKELAARRLLCQSLNLEELAELLPIDLFEHIKHIIIKDQNLLPFLMKKIGGGRDSRRNDIIDYYELLCEPSAIRLMIPNLSDEEIGNLVFLAQTFINKANNILKNGTLEEINHGILIVQEVFNAVLNFSRDGNDDISQLNPISQEIVESIIAKIKESHLDLGYFKQIDLYGQRIINGLFNNLIKQLNLMFETEKRILQILKNKNIDLNKKYRYKTALEWAIENNNKEMSKLLSLEKTFQKTNLNDFYRNSYISPLCLVSFSVCLFIIYYNLQDIFGL